VEAADDYAASIAAWDAERDARLRSPDGWLALVGLHWLTDGSHDVGSDPGNPIHLSGRGVPPRAGSLEIARGHAIYRPKTDSRAAAEVPLTDDLGGSPTIIELGSLRFHLVRRGERLGLRVRDTEAPILKAFPGVPRFPIDPAWRVTGRLERPPGLRTVDVPDVLGEVRQEESPGVVHLTIAGQDLALEALQEDDNALWLIFGDATNGQETYSGGRFLVSDPVAQDGSVVVDFNLAYNPPCVFSPYATCPLPWPANVLPVAVRAGERVPGQPDR
jgi:hypothetical protein